MNNQIIIHEDGTVKPLSSAVALYTNEGTLYGYDVEGSELWGADFCKIMDEDQHSAHHRISYLLTIGSDNPVQMTEHIEQSIMMAVEWYAGNEGLSHEDDEASVWLDSVKLVEEPAVPCATATPSKGDDSPLIAELRSLDVLNEFERGDLLYMDITGTSAEFGDHAVSLDLSDAGFADFKGASPKCIYFNSALYRKTPALDGIPVRYFYWHPDDDDTPTVSECSEEIFRQEADNGGVVTYERHTVRENGVNQICFTVNAYE